MNTFPLYNTLAVNIPKKDLTVRQKADFMKKIKDIGETGHELIYLLIKHYYIITDFRDTPTFSLPYGGSTIKNDICFNLEDLPIPLKHIIYKFVKMEIERIKSEPPQTEL